MQLFRFSAGVLADNGNVCILVRTHTGHAAGRYNIQQMLFSLIDLEHKNWQAFITVHDGVVYKSLDEIVASLDDSRLQVSYLIINTLVVNIYLSIPLDK